ncbi:MAG: Ig-like domain-containing protein, partial [Clostridia bacterium]|nr:Ig-like domain-containing protein [Clostridia bacterium]
TEDDATSVTYGDTLQFSVSGNHGAGHWSVNDETLASIDNNGLLTALKGTGTVTVTYKSFGDATYNLAEVTKEITLNKKQLTVSAVINSKPYDGTTAGTGSIILEGIVGDDAVTATGTFEWVSADVDTTTFNVTGITLSADDAENYVLNVTVLENLKNDGVKIEPKGLSGTLIAVITVVSVILVLGIGLTSFMLIKRHKKKQ